MSREIYDSPMATRDQDEIPSHPPPLRRTTGGYSTHGFNHIPGVRRRLDFGTQARKQKDVPVNRGVFQSPRPDG